MADIQAGNLYDMNKMLVAKNEKHLRGKALQNKIEQEVLPYFQDKANEKYFMLLCHEKRDYTVFHINQYNIEEIVDILKLCLHNRGAIYGIDRTQEKDALEIWIRADDNKEMACYYLFPYSQAIVELGSV